MLIVAMASAILLAAAPAKCSGPSPGPSASPNAQSRPVTPLASPTPAGPTVLPTMAGLGGPIPLAYDLGKPQGDLSPAEASYLARHASVVSLNFFGTPGHPYAYIEPGVYAQVALIRNAAKAAGVPGPKLCEYWGFALDGHTDYQALQDPVYLANKATWMVTPPGAKQARLDITQPAARAWWDGASATMLANGGLDCGYYDGAENVPKQNPPDPWGVAKAALFAGLRSAVGPSMGLIINGEPGNCIGSGLCPSVSGVMKETWNLSTCGSSLNDPPTPKTPAYNLAILQDGYALASAGYDFWLKAWPTDPTNGGSFLCSAWNNLPYAQQVAQMANDIPVALAAALVINVPPHTFLAYSSGYDDTAWMPVVGTDPSAYGVDERAYSALWADYGAPLGPPTITGYTLQRTYVNGPHTTMVTLVLDSKPLPTATIVTQ
jgi:hypothetical protein